MMTILIVSCLFILEITTAHYVQPCPTYTYNGEYYHFVNHSSAPNISEIDYVTYCEYTYDNKDANKPVMMIFASESDPRTIGFLCTNSLLPGCCGLRCCCGNRCVKLREETQRKAWAAVLILIRLLVVLLVIAACIILAQKIISYRREANNQRRLQSENSLRPLSRMTETTTASSD